MRRLLLCTDLDRTLIPNGAAPESPEAGRLFGLLARREEITLAYVSGRHRGLIEIAMREFDLPRPDFAIADVGASIYEVSVQGWRPWRAWVDRIASEWRGMNSESLRGMLRGFDVLRLQEREKQAPFKLSYYVGADVDAAELEQRIQDRLLLEGIRANLIWSVDESAGVGLLDVLPRSAGKLSAIRFLMARYRFLLRDTIFVGDSGNDLDVLLSDIPAVLVGNASPEIKAKAVESRPDSLYVARGGYLGLNGNYCAGVLEGVAHFWPETDGWLREFVLNKEE